LRTELGVIVRVRAVDKPLTKDELIKDYGDVFKGLGKLPKAHHIQLDPGRDISVIFQVSEQLPYY
jgi:hypothetical protein